MQKDEGLFERRPCAWARLGRRPGCLTLAEGRPWRTRAGGSELGASRPVVESSSRVGTAAGAQTGDRALGHQATGTLRAPLKPAPSSASHPVHTPARPYFNSRCSGPQQVLGAQGHTPSLSVPLQTRGSLTWPGGAGTLQKGRITPLWLTSPAFSNSGIDTVTHVPTPPSGHTTLLSACRARVCQSRPLLSPSRPSPTPLTAVSLFSGPMSLSFVYFVH